MKKSNLITIILLIYLGVLSVWGWNDYKNSGDYMQYFATIGTSVVVILLLRYVLNKREKMRSENRKRRDAADRRVHRDDTIH